MQPAGWLTANHFDQSEMVADIDYMSRQNGFIWNNNPMHRQKNSKKKKQIKIESCDPMREE